MSDGTPVAEAAELEPGEALVVPAEKVGAAEDIAVFRDDDGSYWALDNICSHAYAELSDGWIEQGAVECPVHSSQFCLRTGRPSGPPATRPVRTHRVEIRDGQVWLFAGVATVEAQE